MLTFQPPRAPRPCGGGFILARLGSRHGEWADLLGARSPNVDRHLEGSLGFLVDLAAPLPNGLGQVRRLWDRVVSNTSTPSTLNPRQIAAASSVSDVRKHSPQT
jgi:hypothetical protein